MKKYLIGILLLAASQVNAQKGNNKINKDFYLLPQTSLLVGNDYKSGQFLLSGMLEQKGWGIGIGTGIDIYKLRTIPVFAHLQKDITKGGPLFTYLRLGGNIVWPTESQAKGIESPFFNSKVSFQSGLYADLGVGYKLGISKKNPVTISVGYSRKTVMKTFYDTIIQDFPPYHTEKSEHSYQYNLNRLALAVGIKL